MNIDEIIEHIELIEENYKYYNNELKLKIDNFLIKNNILFIYLNPNNFIEGYMNGIFVNYFIYFKRNFIDCYILNEPAESLEINKYENIDEFLTTEFKQHFKYFKKIAKIMECDFLK